MAELRGGDGYLGAYLTRADSDMLARLECGMNGCNPGGQCLFIEMPEDVAERIPESFLHRLLTQADVEALDRIGGGEGTAVRVNDGSEVPKVLS